MSRVDSDNNVQMSVTKPQVKLGDNVTFNCNIRNFQAGQFVKWFKMVMDVRADGSRDFAYQEIGTSTLLSLPYTGRSNQRYVIREQSRGNALLLSLTITGTCFLFFL